MQGSGARGERSSWPTDALSCLGRRSYVGRGGWAAVPVTVYVGRRSGRREDVPRVHRGETVRELREDQRRAERGGRETGGWTFGARPRPVGRGGACAGLSTRTSGAEGIGAGWASPGSRTQR